MQVSTESKEFKHLTEFQTSKIKINIDIDGIKIKMLVIMEK